MSEPDWSESKTGDCEIWKNPLIPMDERLLVADGAIRFRNEQIAKLKEQNAQLQQSLADALLQVQEALTRMDRARNLLTDGNPRLHCNWGMLDTSDIKAALPAAYVGLVDNF